MSKGTCKYFTSCKLQFNCIIFKVIARYFDVLLTVYLSIILATDQLNAQILVL